jgi:DNA-binding NarL/FixJ family response regulator
MSKMKRLSRREEEIIELYRQGFCNRDIGVKLDIDQKTVSTYAQRMRVKLGLDSSTNIYKLVSTYLRVHFPVND